MNINFTIEELNSLSNDELIKARNQTQEHKTREEKILHMKICRIIETKIERDPYLSSIFYPFEDYLGILG